MLDTLLSNWINLHYLKETTINYYQKKFQQNKPFPFLELSNFFQEEKTLSLLKALTKEKFFSKESDLFTFLQTNDFKGTKNKTLTAFREFLSSTEFVQYLSNLTGTKLNRHLDIFGTIYRDTNYLLPHDDLLEKRRIAYFLYLSNLKEKEGGQLLLYDSIKGRPTKVDKKILPQFNTLAFFKVSNKSFHQVEEVIGNNQRITITGWFHGN